MKTIIKKGDRILWFFLVATLVLFVAKMSEAQSINRDVLKVKISGNGFSDETFIRFMEEASVGFESDKDAWKMFSMNPNVPMIFTKVDGYAVSLNSFPPLDKKLKMDLFTKIKNAGNYTLRTRIISPFSDSVKIFLVDKLMNEIYNIRTDSVINFSLFADSGNTARFQMYFSTPVRYSAKDLSCFKNKDGEIFIENLNEQGWQIDIVDENNVFQKSATGTSESFSVGNLHGGNYFSVVHDFSGSENFEIKVNQPYPVLSMFESSSNTVCLCDGGTVGFYNFSVGATNYSWDFGDGTKSNEFQTEHVYSGIGENIVSLVVSNGQCSDTSYAEIKVLSELPLSVEKMGTRKQASLFFDGDAYIFQAGLEDVQNINVEVYNILGQKIQHEIFRNPAESKIRIIVPGKGNQLFIFILSQKKILYSQIAL